MPSTLKTPDGFPAGKTDRIMLLAMWAKHLSTTRPMIYAGMGKPTLPISSSAAFKAAAAWSSISDKAGDAHNYFADHDNTSDTRDKVAAMGKDGAVIDYGHPQGDEQARAIMARALSKWYQSVTIKPEHILFTVGGAGAIHDIFAVINDLNPGAYIVTPFPHYSLHASSDQRTKLHPINVLKERGYRLTKEALEKSIFSARKKNRKIAAFLFCDPNNPLGTVVNPEAWAGIATVLRENPGIPIILDEAYAEMCLDGKPYVSLLEVAPDLQDRIILMRSATKALSAAGERMAVAVTSNSNLMSLLVAENIRTVGHAPFIHQGVFARVLDTFGPTNREELAKFYGPQVELAANRLKAMGAYMPDADYRVDGTFYMLCNLEDLKDLDIPKEAEAALGKTGKLETDEDIAYFLLFKGLMVAPLSYFGVAPEKSSFIRITCSGGDREINSICDLLEETLTEARKMKKTILEQQIVATRDYLDKRDIVTLEARHPLLKSGPSTTSPLLKAIGVPIPNSSASRQITPLSATSVDSDSRESSFSRPNTPVEAKEDSLAIIPLVSLPPTSSSLESASANFASCASASTAAPTRALQLKQQIEAQRKFLDDARAIIVKGKKEREQQVKDNPHEMAASTIQKQWRQQQNKRALSSNLNNFFARWVANESTIPASQALEFSKLTAQQRQGYKPWLDHLSKYAADEKSEPLELFRTPKKM